jgi:hypothetical protein
LFFQLLMMLSCLQRRNCGTYQKQVSRFGFRQAGLCDCVTCADRKIGSGSRRNSAAPQPITPQHAHTRDRVTRNRPKAHHPTACALSLLATHPTLSFKETATLSPARQQPEANPVCSLGSCPVSNQINGLAVKLALTRSVESMSYSRYVKPITSRNGYGATKRERSRGLESATSV